MLSHRCRTSASTRTRKTPSRWSLYVFNGLPRVGCYRERRTERGQCVLAVVGSCTSWRCLPFGSLGCSGQERACRTAMAAPRATCFPGISTAPMRSCFWPPERIRTAAMMIRASKARTSLVPRNSRVRSESARLPATARTAARAPAWASPGGVSRVVASPTSPPTSRTRTRQDPSRSRCTSTPSSSRGVPRRRSLTGRERRLSFESEADEGRDMEAGGG